MFKKWQESSRGDVLEMLQRVYCWRALTQLLTIRKNFPQSSKPCPNGGLFFSPSPNGVRQLTLAETFGLLLGCSSMISEDIGINTLLGQKSLASFAALAEFSLKLFKMLFCF